MNNKEDTVDTKLILISDIRSKTQSILPFGLHMAKYLQVEVDIIHIVDVRNRQGVSDKHAHSESRTPHPKLSFDKMVEREIEEASQSLDEVLSKEDFSLKINKVVKEGRINKEIEKSVKNSAQQCFLIISEEVDGYIFHSRKELIELIQSIDAVTLLVPPKNDFQVFKDIALITDFSNNFGLSAFSKTASLFHKFNPQITAVDIARPKRYSEKELKGKKWQQAFKDSIFGNIKTQVLKGRNHSTVIQEYIYKTKPDLIIYSYRKLGFINHMFHNSFLENLLKRKEYPIMYLP